MTDNVTHDSILVVIALVTDNVTYLVWTQSFSRLHAIFLAGSILECSRKYSFSFDASEVGTKVLSGFHLRTDAQLWALAGCCVCGL